MLVYRKTERIVRTWKRLKSLISLCGELKKKSRIQHADSVDLLIEYGAFESAITDALSPDRDCENREIRTLRQVALLSGRIFYLSWHQRWSEIGPFLEKFHNALLSLSLLSLPATMPLRVPEGYAHYGLYPETYLEAAKNFFHGSANREVVCIGLRSIGTSLSAAVGGALQELGCNIVSFTFRPRGHPFNREPELSAGLQQSLQSLRKRVFLLVDEGPGLSGSSFCGAARVLSDLGIPDEQITIFPSWTPDGANFFSESSREIWARHKKYSCSFEDTWLNNGHAEGLFLFEERMDISAGFWRSFLYWNEQDYPASHPHHERRKYLCSDNLSHITNHFGGLQENCLTSPPILLMKFAGLGEYGRAKVKRAEYLAERNISPDYIGVQNGFIGTHFIYGKPVSAKNVCRPLLDSVAHYTACLSRDFRTDEAVPFETLHEMIRENIEEGLGPEWAGKIEKILNLKPLITDNSTVAIDGRMLPHEWLLVENGFIKADALDHHADQFFPGCQDIAWDLAGCILEFNLSDKAREYVIQQYVKSTQDISVNGRVPFYMIAYLSYRMGYAWLAEAELGGSPEGLRFRQQLDNYTLRLKDMLKNF